MTLSGVRLAIATAVLVLLAHAAHARDAREEVRIGVLRGIGFGIAAGELSASDPLFLPVCGDPAELRTPLHDARAPWRAAYPHLVRSEPAYCAPSRVDGPR